jgi:hypothetical protein
VRIECKRNKKSRSRYLSLWFTLCNPGALDFHNAVWNDYFYCCTWMVWPRRNNRTRGRGLNRNGLCFMSLQPREQRTDPRGVGAERIIIWSFCLSLPDQSKINFDTIQSSGFVSILLIDSLGEPQVKRKLFISICSLEQIILKHFITCSATHIYYLLIYDHGLTRGVAIALIASLDETLNVELAETPVYFSTTFLALLWL